MVRSILALLLVALLIPAAHGQSFYDVDSVRTIEITFPQSNWDHILDSLYAAGNDERLLGTVVIDGVQYDSVGVRYKGNSTYNPVQAKNPFNIKLDYIKDDQLIQGYGTLKLANGKMDPSMLRDVLSYEIASPYMPACRANYCNVWVNGVLIGLYVNVQDIDKLYCRTFFHSGDNPLFKGEYDGFPNGVTVWGYLGEDSASYATWFQIDSDSGWLHLIDFLDTLNNYPAAVSQVMNIDRHLWMLAFDLLLVNLDAPINMGHNFYLYEDDNRRFNSIIWDLNMSFGGFTQVVGGSPLNLTTMQQLTPYFNATNIRYPMVRNILSNASWKKMYVAHMKTMLQEMITSGWYETRALEIRDIIAPHVAADPNSFYTYSNFYNNIYSTAGAGPNSAVGLVQLMAGRATYLSGLADFTATAPTITNVSYSPTELWAGGTVWVTASVSNAANVTLRHRDVVTALFDSTAMYDDGAHHDGSSGDGVYGASISAGISDIHYYMYAENSAAGTFLPPRAEFEDSIIQVSLNAGLVINEFMADNVSTQMDQDGEYDDWVELYNNSSAPVELAGYYLSDNASKPTKWTFPDTSIAANGFLVIWADEDTSQVGLHAMFKLSAGGEAVVLCDPTVTVVDQITYGAQTGDVSFGRLPNGTGDFVGMVPTFGAVNGCCVGVVGNLDGDAANIVDISDLSALVDFLFFSGAISTCDAENDLDASGTVDISDLSAIIDFLFFSGTLRACP